MKPPKILLFTNDNQLRDQVEQIAENLHFDIHRTDSSDTNWIEEMIAIRPEVVLAQPDNFNENDLKSLQVREVPENTEILLISEGKPNPYIDRAMLCGVTFHLRIPIDDGFLNDVLNDLYAEYEAENQPAETVLSSNLDQFGLLLGSSKPIRKLYRVIRRAASSDASVFLIGESGVGKELVAKTVHQMSDWRDNPLISLNCGAMTPDLIESELFGHVKGAFTGATDTRSGVFEQAHNSTLFLDEVTEMPQEHQVKLLRVLETGEFRKVGGDAPQKVNFRVIAATNREPNQATADELFREDLYFRLAQFPIRIPPLRERGDDIAGLAKHFLAYRNSEEQTNTELATDALEKIKNHDWPGNVRELKHTIERAYVLADDEITADHIVLEKNEATGGSDVPTGLSLGEVEKQVILKTLEETQGNKKEAADQLGISVKTLYNRLERYQQEDSARDT